VPSFSSEASIVRGLPGLGIFVSLILLSQVSRAATPDGGPGGACVNDSDCGICGWVCSWPRGQICIPAMEGDPGHCTVDAGGCSCPGQSCSNAAICAPAANPQCACNSDCPSGQICDQLLFTCHAQSAVSCGADYHGYDFGPVTTGPSCGCGYICSGGSEDPSCQVQCFSFPPECSSDLDCGACNWNWICAPPPGAPAGTRVCMAASSTVSWCNDARDVSPISEAGVLIGCSWPDGGSSVDGGVDEGARDAGGTEDGGEVEAHGCGCSQAGASEELALLLVGLLFAYRRGPRSGGAAG
jgi:hypothetical protein